MATAPFWNQVQLRCSVNQGYGIDWKVVLTANPDIEFSTGIARHVDQLRGHGIETIPWSSITHSLLAINGTAKFHQVTATCNAYLDSIAIISECRSRISQVTFYG